ncbi:right-handed parallel beta-helix repeat-containing protein [Pseudomonas sp. NPDC007930]|uniref:right-handed parallel beta-helix repeat-containing protein n=1 Tax=Pseudomonas sp. NPDC007930 TaxID=3364417 RepID=UPI0036E89C3B
MAVTLQASAYGALGNNSHDDTQALQAAIDAAAAQGGGSVHLGAGTYRVSSSEAAQGGCLLLKVGVTLVGDGIGTTVIQLADGVNSAAGLVRAGGNNVGLHGLTLDGNGGSPQGQVDGWVSAGFDAVHLTSIEARHASGYGLYLRAVGGTVEVSDATVWDNGRDGILSEGVIDSRITDSLVYANGGSGLNLAGEMYVADTTSWGNNGDGIQLYQTANQPVRTGTSTIEASTVYGNNGDGIQVVKLDGFEVTGNEVYGNASYGIHLDLSRNGAVYYNQVHGNNADQESAEIWIEGIASNPSALADYIAIRYNLVNGRPGGFYGIVEPIDSGDYNRIEYNVINGLPYPAGTTGPHSLAAANAAWVLALGTARNDAFSATLVRTQLYGNAGNDHLTGGSAADRLVGGAGSDSLSGGLGADVFVFNALTDSYRTASQSHADRVLDFDLGSDRLDLTAMGVTGVGSGLGTTVKVMYDATRDLTYLKQLSADSEGRRGEWVLQGDARGLTDANFQQRWQGEDGPDRVTAHSAQPTTYETYSGRDHISAGAGDDRLIGGADGDRLSGGGGADTFVYTALGDSLRGNQAGGTSGRDQILDFNAEAGDLIDLSALGYTGMGNGYGSTLKAVAASDGSYTVLKSYEVQADGRHFELYLAGDQRAALFNGSVIFSTAPGSAVAYTPDNLGLDLLGDGGRDQLAGDAGDDRLRGVAGNDKLDGRAGDDVLVGGAGTDTLTGGSGDDTFVYQALTDSFRQPYSVFADTITDFLPGHDRLDVSALGFTGLGDGHGTTLQVTDLGFHDRTVVRSLEPNAAGQQFEIRLLGDHPDLGEASFVFAS